MNKIKFISKFLVIISLIIGIELLCWGIGEKIEFSNRTEGYESVEGYLIDTDIYSEARLRARGRSKPTTYSLIYAYSVNGTSYTVETDYGTASIPQMGSVKTIKYNPADPSEAVVTGTNGPTIMIYGGLFFTLIPLVMILAFLAISGKLGKLTFNIMDIVIGLVFFVIGLASVYVISGTFSILPLLQYAGPFAAIPVMFVIVGVYMIWKGIFAKNRK